jgi:hypothetical protein
VFFVYCRDFVVAVLFERAIVAMAMLLLIGAGLFGRSLINLYRIDPGFDTGRVLSVLIDPRAAGYPPDSWKTLYDELTERLKAVPGVESLSSSQCPLLSDCNVSGGPYEFSGLDRPRPSLVCEKHLVRRPVISYDSSSAKRCCGWVRASWSVS